MMYHQHQLVQPVAWHVDITGKLLSAAGLNPLLCPKVSGEVIKGFQLLLVQARADDLAAAAVQQQKGDKSNHDDAAWVLWAWSNTYFRQWGSTRRKLVRSIATPTP
jgi:hypothetical protein